MAARRHTPDLDLVHRTLAHYRVLDRLGKGGMGEVFLAEDLRLGRRVALKVLSPVLATDTRYLERFEREARSVAALNHPNIVTIHAVEEYEGLQFLVMELVEGETLEDLLLSRGPFPLEELLDIALALTRALEAAHARGIVHRDLKPRNVMVNNEGRVKVLDFGIASITANKEKEEDEEQSEEATLTGSGVLVGTPLYMSPEQIQGRSVDPRADLFSLGILLFEMATGQRPFQGVSRLAILGSILSDTPPPARSLRPDLPPRFDEILALCLAKEPFLRYRSAARLREDLSDLASGKGVDLSSTLVAIPSLQKAPAVVHRDRSPHSTRLPASPRCFGREKEVRELVEALCADPPFPVPVLGPAGAGKSTIILAALHHPSVTERFGKRRFFVRCDGATDRDGLAAAIARLVCPKAQPPLGPIVLLELEQTPAVLVLDNFETPWEHDTAAVEEVLSEIAAVPGLALVVALRGEQRPFGPDWREAIRARPLDTETTRNVFLAFAGERFRDDPYLDPLLVELDGLALAVVLLASQAEGEPDLSGLRQRWREQRTALLHRGLGRERQHSLEVSLQLSIESPRMTDGGLRLLSLLSLLPEGVAREDLAALLEPGPEAASVLRKVGLAFDQGSRLRVLAPIREYVQRSHPPREEDLDRAVDHYLALARIGEKIGTERGAEAADRLRAEMGNLEPMILAGLERADPIPAIYSALAYTEAVRFTGIGGLTLIGCARQAARVASQAKLEADCIRKWGDIEFYRAHYEQAWGRYEQAREIYQQTGASLEKFCCTARLAEIHLLRAQPMAASRLYEEARARFQELGDRYWEAHCLLGLGTAAVQRSDYETARTQLMAARTFFQNAGDLLHEANCLLRMGQASFDLGQYENSRTEFEAALLLFRRVGSLLGEASCLRNLGHIALQQGHCQAAQSLGEEALLLSRRVGSRLGEANCLFILGEAARLMLDHERAEALFQDALPVFQQVGQAVGAANCHASLGLNAMAQSQSAKARPWLEEALRLNQQVPRPSSIGRSHLQLAQLEPPGSLKRLRHIEAARQVWEEAGILDQLRHELEAVPVD